MKHIDLKFNQQVHSDFARTLKQRVNDYFAERKISRSGNYSMVLKTIFVFTVYLSAYALMLSNLFPQPWQQIMLWAVMGFGIAGIGLTVMHDANHGAYARNKKINRYLGMALNFVGGHAELWKIQHNMLHHAYTNIDGADEDIEGPSFLRFSPYQERKKIHRWQHLYAWFFYALMTFFWVTGKDFLQLNRFRRTGLITEKKYRKVVVDLIFWKIFYYAYILVVPLFLVQASPWVTISGFLLMHGIGGFILSIIFQPAHVIPAAEFSKLEPGKRIDEHWMVHQLKTTADFAPRNKIFSWLVGGLNFQVEHHLFPNVCHVHYHNLAKIVKETTRQFNLPYNSYNTFISALVNHARMLRNLGQGKMSAVKVRS